MDAGGKASGLEGVVVGVRLAVSYRWPMDKIGWLRETSVSWSGLDIAARFGLDFRGHFNT